MSRKRILIIHNPTSGRRNAEVMATVAVRLTDLGARVDIRVTEGSGHASELAAEVETDSQDCIIAAGGDGTVNEVMNGMIKLDAAPPLGIIPLGTANVLAHEIDLPLKAAGLARVLFEGPTRVLYPGIVNSAGESPRLFAQMTGAGLDARIVAGVNPALKRLFGKGAYGVETMAQWLRGGLPSYDICIDGEKFKAGSVIIANGKLYGGKFVAAPMADISTPGFQVLLLPGGRLAMLGNAAALFAGRLSQSRDVRVVTGHKISLNGPMGEPLQADGDLLGHLPVTVEASEKPVMVVTPE